MRASRLHEQRKMLEQTTNSHLPDQSVGVSTIPTVIGGWLLELHRAVPSAPLDKSVGLLTCLWMNIRYFITIVNIEFEKPIR
jgi:hypothetical protein